jgi:hypothetical protein
MSFIYLASPYSSDDPAVVKERYEMAAEMTANILNKGVHIYSPIVHCHELAHKYSLPKDFKFWKEYNFSMLEAANELWILTIEGWDTSEGVKNEMYKALALGMIVRAIPYEGSFV